MTLFWQEWGEKLTEAERQSWEEFIEKESRMRTGVKAIIYLFPNFSPRFFSSVWFSIFFIIESEKTLLEACTYKIIN